MYTNLSNDLKLYIFSFLSPQECFETLIVNYYLYTTYMNNMFPYKHEKKILDGYYFNDKNKCFYCYEKLDNQFMINMCHKCNLNTDLNYDYIKVCNNCLSIHNHSKANLFKLYTNNKKYKTNVFNYFKCKNVCEKMCTYSIK
jgi:hypothetical protein